MSENIAIIDIKTTIMIQQLSQSLKTKNLTRIEARQLIIEQLRSQGIDTNKYSQSKLNSVIDQYLKAQERQSKTLGQIIINVVGGLGIIASVSIPSTLENKTLAVLGTSMATIMTQNAVHLSQNKAKRDLEEGR